MIEINVKVEQLDGSGLCFNVVPSDEKAPNVSDMERYVAGMVFEGINEVVDIVTQHCTESYDYRANNNDILMKIKEKFRGKFI